MGATRKFGGFARKGMSGRHGSLIFQKVASARPVTKSFKQNVKLNEESRTKVVFYRDIQNFKSNGTKKKIKD